MSTYAFKAIDPLGTTTQGEIEGADQTSVINQLRARGLIVLKFEERKPTDVGDIFSTFQRVKARDLTIMTRQLATMISSGIPLLKSLYVLEDQTINEHLRRSIIDVRKSVESGSSLSEALANQPKIFNDLYVAMVRAGETGGILEDSLLRLSDQLEKADSLKRQIKAAMIYPILIGSFALIVLIALVVFLLPVFAKVFKQIDPVHGDKDLPAITKVSIGFSHLITDRWYLIIAAIVFLVAAFRYWKKSESGKRQWDWLKMKIPFRIGSLVHKIALARFSRTFAGLVSGGVPMLETLEITRKTAGNAVVADAMTGVIDSVRSGGTLAAPMKQQSRAFPPMVHHMVQVGEDSGSLDKMLSKIADFYEDEVAADVKGLSSLLEPLMLIFVGAAVGFIVISMYLPLFQLYDKIR